MLKTALRDAYVRITRSNGDPLVGKVIDVTHGHLCLMLLASEGDGLFEPLPARQRYIPHSSPVVEDIEVLTESEAIAARAAQRQRRPLAERWEGALAAMNPAGVVLMVLHAQARGLVLQDHAGNSSLYNYQEIEPWTPMFRAELKAWVLRWLARGEGCQRIVAAAQALNEALLEVEEPDLSPVVLSPVHEWLKLLGHDLQVASKALDQPEIPTREELEAEGDAWRAEMDTPDQEPEATSFGSATERTWAQERPSKPVIVDVAQDPPWGWVEYVRPCAKCGEPVKVPIKREEPPSEEGDARAVALFQEFLDPEELADIRHDTCEIEEELEQQPEGSDHGDGEA